MDSLKTKKSFKGGSPKMGLTIRDTHIVIQTMDRMMKRENRNPFGSWWEGSKACVFVPVSLEPLGLGV